MHLKLKVLPGAKRPCIEQISKDTFKISVKEKAERGEANRAALFRLAVFLGIPHTALTLTKGHRSPSKIVRIPDSLWKNIP